MRDLLFNGQAFGDVASKMMACDFNTDCLRPFLGRDDRGNDRGTFINVNENGKTKAQLIGNVTATLRKDEWKTIDLAIIKVVKPRLKAVGDLRAAGLTYTIANGMGKTVLETETVSDIGPASVSMDGMRENQNDRPAYELTNLPLPIIHKDFSFSARQIATSRNTGSSIDTTSAELAGRRVAEEAEKLLLGNSTVADQYSFGGGIIYGYTDFPNRLSYDTMAPSHANWNGARFLLDLLGMRQALYNKHYYGPFMVYISPTWDQYIDDDFKAASDKSIRNRAKEINGILDIKTLDYLTGNQMLMVQMTTDVVREVIGMDIVTLKWETLGGLLLNFKVMAILVPQLRCDQEDNCGLCHGS